MKHHSVETNGIRLHVAELGDGPAVVLCHGWPETWYSWRHQLQALSEAGFRVLAPDMRGYGRSDRPEPVEAYTLLHIAGDMVGLLDALDIAQAVIIGHDWGAPAAWHSALLRPDRFRAVAGLSVPYRPRGKISPIDAFKAAGMENFYMMYFQEPGVAEREFERDVGRSLSRIYYGASGSLPEGQDASPFVMPGKGLLDSRPDAPMPLPWLSALDLDNYVQDFRASGFRGGLNWYRNLHRNWELMAPFHRAVIRQPSLFIAGSRDAVIRMPGVDVSLETMRRVLPGLTKSIVLDGPGHWVQQEAPDAVNAALIAFLRALPVLS
jgi:pimeloyl-ACP methyl ester carboxylesterase